MSSLKLYGFPVSPNVRSARIALAEKGLDYTFEVVSLDELASEAYGKLNPFRKMPVLQHDERLIYETPAILGYLDEAFSGPSLQPESPQERARMRQWMGIASHYLYPVGVMQLFLQRVMMPIMGNPVDEALVTEASLNSVMPLNELESALSQDYLTGETLSLADIMVGAMVAYINLTPEGQVLLQERPRTATWLHKLNQRASFQNTLAELLQVP